MSTTLSLIYYKASIVWAAKLNGEVAPLPLQKGSDLDISLGGRGQLHYSTLEQSSSTTTYNFNHFWAQSYLRDIGIFMTLASTPYVAVYLWYNSNVNSDDIDKKYCSRMVLQVVTWHTHFMAKGNP